MEDLEEIKGGFLDLFVRSTSAENNVTNTSGTQSEHGGHSNTGTVLFLFTSFAVGALVRHVLKQTPIPYTVILICLGLAFGAASNAAALYDTLVDFTSIARIDPHLMQFVFLPILIFESAFVMDVHTFKKTIAQALILAGPGLMASTALTAVIVKFVFMFDWSWVAALVFGAIVSATDPVAVVAILKDVGASKQLGTIIEGESLLNDGAAIVLFNVLLYELIPGQSQTALQISVSFIRVAFGGPAFGYLVAKIAIFWLARVFNDALVEITITLASTYIAFYVGEGFFGVSGVLAVVTLGIELNSKRTNISPEVEVFLHRFWSMLGYLANTLIFILVGVVISQRAFLQVSEMDWMYVVPMYIAIMVIRLAVVGALSPLLMQFGYSIDWKEVIVVTWGGLRGAVGLSLALVVLQTPGIPQDTIGSKILFHTAGIVILTLLINATTVGYLLRTLGMSDISNTRQLTMTTAVRRVNEAKQRAVGMLKSDRFLADANWDYVDKKTEIDDPYRFEDYHFEELPNSMAAAANEAAGGNCPNCDTRVPRVPHPKELAELTEEVRLRMLKAEKTSYWRQYEQGMLGRQAVLILNNLADIAVDTKDRFITVKDIKPYWKIPFYFTKARALCLKALHWKSTADPPKPSVKCCIPFHKIVTHFIFEWTFFGIIILNVIFIIVELSIMDTLGLQVLSYFNYVFFTIYLLELILKIIGLRHHYFLSKWNWFDFIIFNALIVDIVVELTVPMAMENGFSPSILRIVRIIRVVRALRLTKFFLPLMIRLVDIIINNKLRFGYDIGKGFVVGVEEMLQQYERLSSILPHKSITRELRKRAEDSRLDVIRSLGRLRKEHPGVALSVKTHHAIRSVLNHCRDTIRQLLGSGVLDEVDAELLLNTIEVKMKRLERTPASLPLPDPKVILLGVSWLSGMDLEGESSVKSCAQLEYFLHKDIIVQCGERPKGLYIIVSGLVKVMTYQREECKKPSVSGENSTDTQFQAPPPPSGKNEFVSTDYYGAGSVIGEFALLEHRASNETVECDTDVQAFRINVEDMEGILATFPHLEEQLWRVNGIRTATELLAKLPEYQDWPANKLLLLCEDAYIAAHPDEPNPTFANSDVYREVVLVSGEVRCLNTRERLVAPVVIPRNMRYLLLISDQPQLLVIPKIQREMRKGSIEPDNVPVYRRKKSFSQKIRFGLAKVVRKVREVLRNAWNVIFKRLRLNRIMPKDSMSSTNVSEHNTSTHSVLDLEESVQNNVMPTIPTSAPPIMNRRIQSIIDRSVPPTSPSSAPPTRRL